MKLQNLETLEKPLSNLWILLNQLNLKTNSFPNEFLSPFVSPRRKLLSIMQQVFTDAYFLGITGEQVNFLDTTLKEIYRFKKDYDFTNEYWYEDATVQEHEDRAYIKALILKAHKEAVVL